MPALPPVSHVLRIDTHFLLVNGSDVSSRLYFGYAAGPPTQAQMTSIATSWSAQVNSSLIPLYATGIVVDNIVCTDLGTATGFVGTSTTTRVGTRVGTANPAQVCAIVDYKIGRRYRGGKPRGYWPFGVEADIQGTNQWSSTFLTACNSGMNTAIANMISSSSGLTITNQASVSYYSGFTTYNGSGGRPKVRATLRPTPLVDVVSARTTNPFLGTQRRRVIAG